jgi:hypothetical protein
MANARDWLGLPKVNTGEFLTRARVLARYQRGHHAVCAPHPRGRGQRRRTRVALPRSG